MEKLGTLKSFLDWYNISVQVTKIAEAGKDSSASYRVLFEKADRQLNLYIEVPLRVGSISVSDALFMLILDASGCEDMKDYYADQEKFRIFLSENDLDSSDVDQFWKEYEGRCHQIDALKGFIGPEILKKLLVYWGLHEA